MVKGVSMVFAEGQSETIVEDIENMVRTYVEKVSYLTFWYLEGWHSLSMLDVFGSDIRYSYNELNQKYDPVSLGNKWSL